MVLPWLIPTLVMSLQRDAVVREEAIRANVSVPMTYAISHVENTRGIPDAVSIAGALGVMQVMPSWQGTFQRECGIYGHLRQLRYNACIGVRVYRHYWWQCHHDETCTLNLYSHFTEQYADTVQLLRRNYGRTSGGARGLRQGTKSFG